jgi:large subunit ribosomal protein L4e
MKANVLDKSGKEKGSIDLPKNFSSNIRKDILLKVFEAQKNMRVSGSKIGAGGQYSASGIIRHRRHVWKTGYGKGMARVPRKIMSRHGSSFNWIGATVASTRGGRRAHPPRAQEDKSKKINKKEVLMAFNSGFSGSVDKKEIEKKYDLKTEFETPLIVNDDVLKLKTKDFVLMLKEVLGEYFEKILKKKKVRAGKGKLRGRKYKSNAGLVFVLGAEEEMKRKGFDVVNVQDLLIKDLAPNAIPGRIVIYTENAIKEIGANFK